MKPEPPAPFRDPDRPDPRRMGHEITARVRAALPGYLRDRVNRVTGSSGCDDPSGPDDPIPAAIDAATRRVVSALHGFFETPMSDQRTTPLEIIRTAGREPTAVLRRTGAPAVARDPFHVRTWPDDRFGLVPDAATDLGDEDLAALLLAWGVVKAAAQRVEISGNDGDR